MVRQRVRPLEPVSDLRPLSAALAFLYTCFVFYASLVPLEFRPQSFADAWSAFESIRFYNLALYSRADWISNGVLFVPIGYLCCAAITRGRTTFLERLNVAAMVFLTVSIAAGILEFAQVYFPPRTVSRNDIYAETIGGAVGCLLFVFLASRVESILHGLTANGQVLMRSLAVCYLVAFLAITFFPFDFLLSWEEFQQRMEVDPPRWYRSDCTSVMRCIVGLSVEILTVAPLAWFLWSRDRLEWRHIMLWLLAGGQLGLAIETIQLATYSAPVSASSVLTRAVGMALGGVAINLLAKIPVLELRSALRWICWLGALPYLVLLAVTNQWTGEGTLSVSEKWESLRFIPFYYHYYNPETIALSKVLVQSMMYMPVGVAWWALASPRIRSGQWWHCGATGMALAGLMAIGRLFFGVGSPDPSNILVAFGASATTYYLLTLLWTRFCEQPSTRLPHTTTEPSSSSLSVPDRWDLALRRLLGATTLAAALAFSATHPVAPFALVAGLAFYTVILWKWPGAWLVAVPAVLGGLDLTQQTGSRYVDEFDILMLGTLGVCLVSSSYGRQTAATRGYSDAWISLLLVTTIAGAVVGFWSSDLSSARSMLVYDSPWNSFRLLKGYCWAIFLYPFVRDLAVADPGRPARLFAVGAAVGLALCSLHFVYERYLFTGLWDMHQPWRAAGSFSSMNVGGASSDNFLVLCMPFLWLLLIRRHIHIRLIALAVATLAAYSVFITFTRTTYLAAVTSGICLGAMSVLRSKLSSTARLATVATVVAALGATAAMPIVYGDNVFTSRWTGLVEDAGERVALLVDRAKLGERSSMHLVFGHGLGRVPELLFAAISEDERPGRASLVSHGGTSLIRLTGGRATFLDYRLPSHIGATLDLSASVRSSTGAPFHFLVCEKHLMNSLRCAEGRPSVAPSDDWQILSQRIDVRAIGFERQPMGLIPPLYFTMVTPSPGQVLEVESVSLRDESGRQLLQNGEFKKGGEHWFFSQDDHLSWHVKNTWLNIFLELGLLGLLVLGWLSITTITSAFASQRAGNVESRVVLCALAAGGVMSLTDAMVDVPRITTLLLLVMFLQRCQSPAGASEATPR